MSKITEAKRKRAGYKIFKTSEGLTFTSTKIGFRKPTSKVVKIIEYKGKQTHVAVDEGQIINPKRIFKKMYKKFVNEQREKGVKVAPYYGL